MASLTIINYAQLDTQKAQCFWQPDDLGILLIVYGKELFSLGWYDTEQEVEEMVQENFPHAQRKKTPDDFIRNLLDFIEGKPLSYPVTIAICATEFQQKVWNQLLSIRRCCTTTYKKIAAQLGDVNAARAVGAAVGANPVAFIIPCHRVLSSHHLLTGYRWGTARKKLLLEREGAQLKLDL